MSDTTEQEKGQLVLFPSRANEPVCDLCGQAKDSPGLVSMGGEPKPCPSNFHARAAATWEEAVAAAEGWTVAADGHLERAGVQLLKVHNLQLQRDEVLRKAPGEWDARLSIDEVLERLRGQGMPLDQVAHNTKPPAGRRRRRGRAQKVPAPLAPLNREGWLSAVAAAMAPWFKDLGYQLPRVRFTLSLMPRRTAVGCCYDHSASADNTHEILIRLDRVEPLDVAAIVAHELVHAVVGVAAGHGPRFRKAARAIGLEGPMRATVAGSAFKQRVSELLDKLGPFPHAALDFGSGARSGPRKQNTRLIKVNCSVCGYPARITRKWLIEKGPVHCPEHGEMNEAETLERKGRKRRRRRAKPLREREESLEDFAARVRRAAVRVPRMMTKPAARGGWVGERRVFLAYVWRQLSADRHTGEPEYSLDAFKAKALEANRARLLTLARADLVDLMNLEDVAESEVRYLGATFHFLVME